MVRTTKSSISIADPDGGAKHPTEGAIYEQSFNAGEGLSNQQQKQSTGEMLKAAFSEHEQSVRAELSASARRISDAILAHEQSMSEAMEKPAERTADCRADMAHHPDGVSAADRHEREHTVVAGQQITDNYTHLRQQEDTLAKMTARTWGVRYQESSDGRRFLILPPGMQTEAIDDGTTWIRLKQE